MYILGIHFNNGHRSGDGRLLIESRDNRIRKWTRLAIGRNHRELLQLTALACTGVQFLPRLSFDFRSLYRTPEDPLHIESLVARHAPYDRPIYASPVVRSGLQVGPEGTVRLLNKSCYRHTPLNVTRSRLSAGSGNTRFFLLAYGTELAAHAGTDDFQFLDPYFRLNRIGSLFSADARLTDPVEFMSRLHYRGVMKARLPAKETLHILCRLFEKYLQIDTASWFHRECDFGKAWRQLQRWQQRAALPAIDAARHMVDAFPRLARPLQAPGLIVLERPDRLCTERLFPIWVELMDRLFPQVQFVLTLGAKADDHFPTRVARKRLALPGSDVTARPKSTKRPHARPGTVLLLDVDGRLPNLALMKISRYFREHGRRVQLARKACFIPGVEEVYASSIFSTQASRRRVQALQDYYGDSLILGGSGVDIRGRLASEIEALPADYGLYPELGNRAIGFLTRGCPYRCPFCLVPAKEGDVRQVADVDSLLQEGQKKLILLDDNILSYERAGDLLEEMAQRELQVNFTQTLDLRLVDQETIQLLRRLHCSNTRFSRRNYHFSLNHARGLKRLRRNYNLFGFGASDNVEFVCMYGFNTTLEEDVERFRFLRSLPGAYVFVQEYQPVLGGPPQKLSGFFDERVDELIDELIGMVFTQNMKSMERYYRWLSKRYAQSFGKLHRGLVDAIFRYNRRDQKGRYIATLAGTRKTLA